MYIVIACDSFKGSAATREINQALAQGAKRACPEAKVVCIPVADGGEGTVDALREALGGEPLSLPVHNALGQPIQAQAVRLPDGTFLLETAAAAGLPQVPPALRDPWRLSSRGVGEMLRVALDMGCRKAYLGLGGSATHDLGMGAMAALGVRYWDAQGQLLSGCGQDMEKVDRIDVSAMDARLKDLELHLITDVDNPLLGERGAARVFSPQKGADTARVAQLEKGSARLAQRMAETLGTDVRQIPGAGAAGGLGAAFMAFCHGQRQQGIDAVLDMADFDARLKGCDLVITGEGRMDGQTASGKTPLGVALRAKKAHVPVLAFTGSIQGDITALYTHGITSIMPLVSGPMTLAEAMEQVLPLAEDAAYRALRLFGAGNQAQ